MHTGAPPRVQRVLMPRARSPHTRTIQLALLGIGIGAAYYYLGRLGLGFRFQNSQIGVVWPANALMLAVLLLAPRARWWQVLTIMAATHILVMQDVVPAWRWSWQIVTNCAFVAGAAELVA